MSVLAEVFQQHAFVCLDVTVGTVDGIHCTGTSFSAQIRGDNFLFKDGTWFRKANKSSSKGPTCWCRGSSRC